MHAPIQELPKSPQEPKPVKKRIITVTNRAPVKIIEDEWPVTAESGWGTDMDGPPWWWTMNMKIRQHTDATRSDWKTHTIIHAVYRIHDEVNDEDPDVNYTARVGRLLTLNETAENYWEHILEVGEELRQRILCDNHKKYVTLVVDDVLSKLPAHPE